MHVQLKVAAFYDQYQETLLYSFKFKESNSILGDYTAPHRVQVVITVWLCTAWIQVDCVKLSEHLGQSQRDRWISVVQLATIQHVYIACCFIAISSC